MSEFKSSARTAVLGQSRAATAAVYLLAEHLDAVLAGGEDLRQQTYDVPKRGERLTAVMVAERLEAEHAFVARVRAHEVALISRVLQARVRAAEVVRRDVRFRTIVALFSGGTRPLVDAVADLGPQAKLAMGFHWSDDALGYYRSRGLIGPDVACLALVDQIAVGDAFRIAGRIELGPLLDLSATFLTTLEIHYDLFEAADDAAAREASAA
jgi:hypothetical protein